MRMNRWRLLILLALTGFTIACQLPRVASAGLPSPPPITHHYIRKNGGKRVIVFVHGLHGDPIGTWTCDSAHYWPKMLADDPDLALADTDIYVASYPTPTRHNEMSISDIITLLRNQMESDRIFLGHQEVVFVAHSLGGVLVEKMLLTYRDIGLYKKVSFIYLFATPQLGSKVADLGSPFTSDPLVQEMRTDHNFILRDMDNEWKHAGFESIKLLCGYERRPTKGFKVVDFASATRRCHDQTAIDTDHINIVKPCSLEQDSYIALRNKLRSDDYVAPPTDPTGAIASPAPQPTYNASAPNGIANAGGTLVNPSVTNIYGARRPPPHIEWTATTREFEIEAPNSYIYRQKNLPVPPSRKLPGQSVGVTVSEIFFYPAFVLTCDKACNILQIININERGESHIYSTAARNVQVIIFDSPRVFSPGRQLLIEVIAEDGNAVVVTNVEPYVAP